MKITKLQISASLFTLLLFLASFVITLIPKPVYAADWYNASWQYARKITIDSTKVDAALTDFPVLVALDAGNFTFGNAQANGNDIRFTTADNVTVLSYEREYHTSPNAYYWVKIPSVASGTDTVFYMYYGNAGAADGADPANVWDSDYKMVQHLTDETTSTTLDSTSNDNDCTKGAANNPIEATGEIYKSQDFDGGDRIDVADVADWDFGSGDWTLSGWFYEDTNFDAAQRLISAGDTTGSQLWTLGIGHHVAWGSGTRYNFAYNDGSWHDYNSDEVSPSVDTWYHYAVKRDGNNIYFFLDGVAAGSTAFTYASLNASSKLTIGCRQGAPDSYTEYWTGMFDEVRVTKGTARSDAWIETSYYSGSDNLLTFGAEQSQAGAPPTCITETCTGFSRDWAIVNGVTTGYGDGATYLTDRGFDYGLTDSYGSSWTESGNFGLTSFSATLSNLNPATVYHYRAKVKNDAAVWGYGEDLLFATIGSPVPYEYWNATGDGNGNDIYGANWSSQTFTTDNCTCGHSITSVKLALKRTGSPGTVEMALKHASDNCTPTGADIAVVSYDGDNFETTYTWYEFELDSETYLSDNTTYAIVVRALGGDDTNDVQWYQDTGGGYADGSAAHSADSAVSWTCDDPADNLFEIWGNPSLSITSAKVYTGYQETDDWLITCLYTNTCNPYYDDNVNVAEYFNLQLVNGATVIAQTVVPEWGYKPGSIYLSADAVAPLEWGSSYNVRISNNEGCEPYMEYTLQPADWQGEDLTRLDTWSLSTAALIELYYGVDLTTYVANKGNVLNDEGNVTFTTGVPGLDMERPHIFESIAAPLTYDEGTFDQSYQDELIWQTEVGTTFTSIFTGWGNVAGLSGQVIGFVLIMIIYVLFAIWAFPAGHGTAAMIVAMPLLIAAVRLGLIDLVYMGIGIGVISLILIWQIWLKNA